MAKRTSGTDRGRPPADSDWLLAKDAGPARLQPIDLALAAWREGHAALNAGRLAEARDWAERALRLGPDDTQVRFLLGRIMVRQNDARAVTVFTALLERSDTLPAYLGLVAAARVTGKPALLRDAVHTLLRRFVPPTNADFADTASRAATGGPGWCAADETGVLTIVGPADVEIALDGASTATRSLASGKRLLPAAWRQARSLSVTLRGRHLLGSPIDLAARRAVDGFVEVIDGGLRGWAWLPANPDATPMLSVTAQTGRFPGLTVKPENPVSYPNLDGLARPRAFDIPVTALGPNPGLLHVRDAWGRDLIGSPLDPGLWTGMAIAAARMAAAGTALDPTAPPGRQRHPVLPVVPVWADTPRPTLPPSLKPLRGRLPPAVVVPVYRGLAITLLCLNRLLETLPGGTPLIVVDDASPEPELVVALDRLAKARRIRLIRNARNRGFPASANIGMRAAGQRDVLLVNSDALVPAGVLERLRDAARSSPDIGTVAPLSNDATILSYPRVNTPQPAPDLRTVARIDRLAAKVNGAAVVDIPTSVGFCMYIRRACLQATGGFREDVFAQGYGEENDFCLRAWHLGWRHVAAPGIFVGHVGGQSFRAARDHLLRRNLGILARLHPGYGALIAAYVTRDPLAPARRRLDLARWRAEPRRPPVVLITHDEGGGVERQILTRCRDLAAAGFRPVILRPDGEGACIVEAGEAQEDLWRADFPNLRFAIPDELPALADMLRRDGPDHVEFHHQLGHRHALLGLAAMLGIPQDIHVHDYAGVCPRVTLVTTTKRYCGEPDHRVCEACIADLGSRLREDIAVVPLRLRTGHDFAIARRVVFPSADAAMRLRRYVPGLRAEVSPWEDDTQWPPSSVRPRRIQGPSAQPGSRRRVAIIGAIGVEKGYEVILACARDAALRDLPLEFVVIGYTRDDDRLIDTGRVFVTYRFEPETALAEIAAQRADIAFIPSIWPETWCFALSDAWAAGLRAAVFDIGTQAERVRATRKGWVLPLALPPSGINNALIALPEAPYE